MLVLTRKLGQEIVIDGSISVKVLSISNGHIRLGIVAPRQVVVNRAEVEMRRTSSSAFNPQANETHDDMVLNSDEDVA